MNQTMKEIIKICTTGKIAEWLRKEWLPKEGDYNYSSISKNISIARDNEEYEEFRLTPFCFWLPISFGKNALQVEELLMKKLGKKRLCGDFYYQLSKFCNGTGLWDKSYVIQCLYWLKELIEKEIQ